mgnify:CR=1 FL=1
MGSEHRTARVIRAELLGRTDMDELLGTVLEQVGTFTIDRIGTVGCD